MVTNFSDQGPEGRCRGCVSGGRMPEGLAEGTMRKLRNAAEAKTFRLPERRDETGLRRAVRVAFRRAGIGTRVRRMPCRRNRKTVAEREFCADTC